MNEDLQHCVQVCTECHQSCLETIRACLEEGGLFADADHIRMLMDCAEICQTNINFMIRHSDLSMVISEACAEICQQCCESCNKFNKIPQLKQAAQVCRRCAEACQQMVS